VTMPVLDGIEATRLIKATNATRHARVIAHTGKPAFDHTVSENLFVAVLVKPAPIDAVIATVQRFAALYPSNRTNAGSMDKARLSAVRQSADGWR
jgi:CheY-like chemotaxis protein